jgi:hypothetical protein
VGCRGVAVPARTRAPGRALPGRGAVSAPQPTNPAPNPGRAALRTTDAAERTLAAGPARVGCRGVAVPARNQSPRGVLCPVGRSFRAPTDESRPKPGTAPHSTDRAQPTDPAANPGRAALRTTDAAERTLAAERLGWDAVASPCRLEPEPPGRALPGRGAVSTPRPTNPAPTDGSRPEPGTTGIPNRGRHRTARASEGALVGGCRSVAAPTQARARGVLCLVGAKIPRPKRRIAPRAARCRAPTRRRGPRRG